MAMFPTGFCDVLMMACWSAARSAGVNLLKSSSVWDAGVLETLGAGDASGGGLADGAGVDSSEPDAVCAITVVGINSAVVIANATDDR